MLTKDHFKRIDWPGLFQLMDEQQGDQQSGPLQVPQVDDRLRVSLGNLSDCCSWRSCCSRSGSSADLWTCLGPSRPHRCWCPGECRSSAPLLPKSSSVRQEFCGMATGGNCVSAGVAAVRGCCSRRRSAPSVVCRGSLHNSDCVPDTKV